MKLSLIAVSPVWAYLWPVVACVLSVVALSTFGGALRRRFVPSEHTLRGRIGLDFALGWLTSCAWFIVQSLLAHKAPFVRMFPLFPALVGCVLLRRDVRLPPLSHVLVFVAATLWHARHFVFSPYPAGDDAAVIAVFVENALREGRFCLSVLPDVGTLPLYPMGATALAWAVASPMHNGLAVMHLFPSLAASALVFALADLFGVRVWWAALLRVSVLALDVVYVPDGLDQSTKLVLGFCFVMGAWLVWRGRAFAQGLGLVTLGVPALVNFANAYVSVAAILVALLWRRSAFGLVLSAAVSVCALAQEPYVLRATGAVCAVDAAAPACTQPDPGTAMIASNASAHVTSPRDAWPAFVHKPLRMLWPAARGLPSTLSAATVAVAAVTGLSVLAGGPALLLLVLVPLLAVAQVTAFYYAVPDLRFMLAHYTTMCLLNLWLAAAAALVVFAARHRWVLVVAIVALVDIEHNLPPRGGHVAQPTLSWQAFAQRVLAMKVPERAMHTASVHDFGAELWVIPDRVSQALESELGRPLRFGYNFAGAWPSAAKSPREYFARVCRDDCSVYRELRIEGVATFGEDSKLCGEVADVFLAKSACFRQADGVWLTL